MVTIFSNKTNLDIFGRNQQFKRMSSEERNEHFKLTKDEKKRLSVMEREFVEDVHKNNQLDDIEGKEDDPYAGLTEAQAEKLEKMRNNYMTEINMKKKFMYDAKEMKAIQEHNEEIDKVTRKCDEIARLIASGRNVAKRDKEYLAQNAPTKLAVAENNRMLATMLEVEDDEKPSELVGDEDKNYTDIPPHEPAPFSNELTTAELAGMPTAKDIVGFSSSSNGTMNNIIDISI